MVKILASCLSARIHRSGFSPLLMKDPANQFEILLYKQGSVQ